MGPSIIMPDTKPCVICDKPLESIFPGEWDTWQPHKGGEIQLLFSYGSCKFDNHMHGTVYRGVICDDCAEKLVPKMTEDSK